MPDCLFCKIIKREIPATIVYEDDQLVAFNDINPQAPLHALIVPKRHIASVNALTPADDALIGAMARCAAKLAADRGYADHGFRTVINTNTDAGQTVFHIHMHVLAGRRLGWPPG